LIATSTRLDGDNDDVDYHEEEEDSEIPLGTLRILTSMKNSLCLDE
jgi:hypothetical protein